MARRKHIRSLAVCLCLAAASASAQAADVTGPTGRADAKAEAGRHFKQGMELANEGEFLQAAIEFQRAYDIAPNFVVLYNLGQAYVGANRSVEAIDALERYLKEGSGKIPKARKQEVEEIIKKQLSRTGLLELLVQPPRATVRIDGREVSTAAPIRVQVGEHQVSVTAPDFRAQDRRVVVAGGDRIKLDFKLESELAAPPVVAAVPPPVPAPAVTAPATAPATAPRRDVPTAETAPVAPAAPVSGGFIAGWVVVGVGVAALATGVGFGAATQAPYQREVEASRNNDLQGYRAAKSEADGLATAANVFYVAGGAAAVAGAILVIATWPKAKPAVAFAPMPGGGVAAVSGTF